VPDHDGHHILTGSGRRSRTVCRRPAVPRPKPPPPVAMVRPGLDAVGVRSRRCRRRPDLTFRTEAIDTRGDAMNHNLTTPHHPVKRARSTHRPHIRRPRLATAYPNPGTGHYPGKPAALHPGWSAFAGLGGGTGSDPVTDVGPDNSRGRPRLSFGLVAVYFSMQVNTAPSGRRHGRGGEERGPGEDVGNRLPGMGVFFTLIYTRLRLNAASDGLHLNGGVRLLCGVLSYARFPRRARGGRHGHLDSAVATALRTYLDLACDSAAPTPVGCGLYRVTPGCST
jgi:hypothetical protein